MVQVDRVHLSQQLTGFDYITHIHLDRQHTARHGGADHPVAPGLYRANAKNGGTQAALLYRGDRDLDWRQRPRAQCHKRQRCHGVDLTGDERLHHQPLHRANEQHRRRCQVSVTRQGPLRLRGTEQAQQQLSVVLHQVAHTGFEGSVTSVLQFLKNNPGYAGVRHGKVHMR